MHSDVKEILFTEEELEKRCVELGKEITEYYKDKEAPVIVTVLKGSVLFFSELVKRIDLDTTMEFMCLSSYENTATTGNVKIIMDLRQDIADKNVLIVEDIIDTGITLTKVKKLMQDRGAKDVKIVTMLDKPSRRKVELEPDYAGFTIPDAFVIGYGLDFNEKYRSLPYIGILKEECYK